MKIFRYEADRKPVYYILALTLLDIVVFSYATHVWQLVIWLALVTFPKAFICSWNHHHQHLHTFYKPLLNRLLEIFYAFHTGVTTNAWVLHHNLGHHIHYLDQKQDESGWKRRNGTTMGEWEYTVKNALLAHWRCYQVGRKHPKYQRGFLTWGSLIGVLSALILYVNWLNGLFVFIFPMVIGYLITIWHTYSHHAGLETEDHHEASHNILHYWYNVFTGNLGFHTAHHMKPGLHWSKLPDYHKTIQEKIPPHLFVKPPFYLWVFSRREFPL